MLTGAYVNLPDLLALRVHPAKARRQTLRRPSPRSGARTVKLRGRGVDFSEVRPYQPGDDVRSIEWRVTARKNKPHTKVFREERERPVLIVVDQTQTMFFGSRVRLKSVAAAELAASAAWRALAHHDRVGGAVIGNQRVAIHKPLLSTKAVARLVADVAQENQALNSGASLIAPERYADGLLQIRRLVRTGFQILLISDFRVAPDAWRDMLQALARHNDLTALRVADPLERELPPSNHYAVTDGQTHTRFHTGERRLRRLYRERFDRQEEALRSLCETWAVRYVPVMTDEPSNADWM